MAWEHLAINKPHLVYIILGGFTSMFMLCSLFIKEKLYIGEATVATICGVIFGPHAADLINPLSWGNVDQVTLEFSRIVLVVQCFAVGVELPKSYMERHWRSVVFLLVPVMTFGWLITSLFVWWMIVPLNWLESLAVAACVTATDPVLASSVVGKGKFAKRVPKHLRDVLSAESGCNDGMAFPFIYLSVYLLRYDLNAKDVVFHWTCYTILYECIFGAIYGFIVGYIGRRAIQAAENAGLIDRESFLVFYFTLALFCAGSGSMLGMDDLLIGFSAGVGFSNDGVYQEKTEESHISNVIDLLLNLAYFVYFGTIIPWDQYNMPELGITPWRLVVIALFVIFFRRIPAMLLLKPLIPDVKTWREALFAGHFGPIGVGAIFAAILARAELETDSSEPLAKLPPAGSHDYELILLVWPVVTFLVLTSILVHGSSIAVFTLGRRINTLALTLSYTKDPEEGPTWMSRLPRIATSKSMESATSFESREKPVIPTNFLARRKETDKTDTNSRSSSLRPSKSRKKKRDSKRSYAGAPVDPSAFGPLKRQSEPTLGAQESTSDTLNEKSRDGSPYSRQPSYVKDRPMSSSPSASPERAGREANDDGRGRRRSQSAQRSPEVEAYREGSKLVVEDEEGNVISTTDLRGDSKEEEEAVIERAKEKLRQDKSGKYAKRKHEPHSRNEGEEIKEDVEEAVENPQNTLRATLSRWRGFGKTKAEGDVEAGAAAAPKKKKQQPERKKGPAHAYQFGNTLIVEDEDGEVIKKYDLPPAASDPNRRGTINTTEMRRGLERLGTYVGIKPKDVVPLPPGLAQLAGNVGAQETKEGENGEEKRDEDSRSPQRKNADQRRESERGDQRQGSQPETDNDDDDDDNRLRITISKTDRYGWTGLHKEKATPGGARPGSLQMGGGRRMSMNEIMKHLQDLNAKPKPETVQEEDAHEDGGAKEADRILRWNRKWSTMASGQPPKAGKATQDLKDGTPGPSKREPTDYFSVRPQTSSRADTNVRTPMSPTSPEPMSPSDASTPGRTPAEAGRSMTTETQKTLTGDDQDGDDDVDDNKDADSPQPVAVPETPGVDIPGIDMGTLLARRRQPGASTAAAARRQRFNNLETIRSASSDDESNSNNPYRNLDETKAPETAAERRRRLAALQGGNDSSDSEEDGRERRVPSHHHGGRTNSDPPHQPPEEMTPSMRVLAKADDVDNAAGGPSRRLQWAGDIGRERVLTTEREENERAARGKADGKKSGGGGLKKWFKS